MGAALSNHQSYPKGLYLELGSRGVLSFQLEVVFLTMPYPFIIATTAMSLMFWRFVDQPGIPFRRHRCQLVLFVLTVFSISAMFCLTFVITNIEVIVKVWAGVEITVFVLLDMAALYLGLKKMLVLQRMMSTEGQSQIGLMTKAMTFGVFFALCSKPFLLISVLPQYFYSQLGWSLFLLGSIAFQNLSANAQFILFRLPPQAPSPRARTTKSDQWNSI